ncbi:hypothetical protein [Actinomycetospora termitidis]|uniref:DUF4333 domain-containing protein n=1 Tax=Actinomycetospora termitidis TaxID=3053470 RepID=A0ABT7MCI0_9PSEU|nr:hypothetical protein [Actinomycetospora sp. Odt1-22]MDL5158376.1 hypothetical protein [Actinomycetospora sp. Odt1-22]
MRWLPVVLGAVLLLAVSACGSAPPSRGEVEHRVATAVADAEGGPAVTAVTATCDDPVVDEQVSCRLVTADGRRGWAGVTVSEASRDPLTARERADPLSLPDSPGHVLRYRGALVLDATGGYDRTFPAPFGTDALAVGRTLTLEVGLALRSLGRAGVVPFSCPQPVVGGTVTCTGRDPVRSAEVDLVDAGTLRVRFAVV